MNYKRNLVFCTEARFTKDGEGNIYGDSSYTMDLWRRYLTTFSRIIIIARVKQDFEFIGNEKYLCTDELVDFIEVPYYVGPWEYMIKRSAVKKIIHQGLKDNCGVFLCRIPGNIGSVVIKYLVKRKLPYGVEVVGDPWDVFAPGSISHPFRLFFRIFGYIELKKNVRKAFAVSYVTKFQLQKRYPVGNNVFSINNSDVNISFPNKNSGVFNTTVSNVNLNWDFYNKNPKSHSIKSTYTLISVGSLEQMYKGPDTLLEALKIINEKTDCRCRLIWLGDGCYKKNMEKFADKLGISQFVDFKGNVNKEEVLEYLNLSDLFVLASKTEGLPRAVIEAMAVGLPCVGTNVGGIPELLESRAMVPKNSATDLASKITEFLVTPDFYNFQALRNLKESYQYDDRILSEKRKVFYNYMLANINTCTFYI